MRAGILDKRISILRLGLSQSASGAPIEAWELLAERRYASIRPFRGTEGFGGAAIVAEELVEIQIRFSQNVADLSPLDRIVYPPIDSLETEIGDRRQYDIQAVHEIGRREGLLIIAKRRVDTSTFWRALAPLIEIVPGTGNLILTGYPPTVEIVLPDLDITPGVGALELTGFAPSVARTWLPIDIVPGTGELALTGYAPTVEVESPAWSPLDLGADLMLWLPLDDPAELWQTSDGTTAVSADNDPIGQAVDQSANARHANQSTSGARPRFRTGTPNYAEFGPDDYLEGPSDFNSTQFGFAARIYRSGSQANGATIFDLWGTGLAGRLIFFSTNRLTLQWRNTSNSDIFNLDNSFFIQAPGTFPDATWADVVVNMGPTAGSIYINGALVRTQNYVSGTPKNANGIPLTLGRQAGASNYFNGRMRNFVVANRPFTEDEIANLVAMP